MDQTVNIPFSIRIDAGDSKFKIEVDKKFIDNPDRLFGFSSVTMTPDYFSRQAFQLNLDSEEELKAVINQDYYIEVECENNALDQHQYYTTSQVEFSSVLRNINKHYEQHKPDGFITPLVVFDWQHLSALSSKVDRQAFYTSSLADLYVGEFDVNTIGTDVSSVFDGLVNLNKFPFPTKEEALDNIIVRVTLAPNVTLAFSNDALPKAIGFSSSQYTQKKNNQLRLQNVSPNSYKSFYCENTANLENIVYATKIHTYPTNKYIVSERGFLVTTKERERKPNLLVTDYNNSINALAKTLNLELSLVHDANEKKFRLVYPDVSGMAINLRVPPYISHRLGFGHVTVIRPSMKSESYPEEIEISNVEALAKVLVYDTGMVVVGLDQQGSKQTYQFTNTVMAIMESDNAGVMTTKPGIEYLRVPVSYFNPNLEFVLSKFNENNEPIPLNWKVGAYIRGLLVGKV
jgi:hypothetical protein